MRRLSIGLVTAGILLALVSCQTTPTTITAAGPCGDIERFLDGELASYQEQLDEAGKRYQEEQWREGTAGPETSAGETTP